MDLRDKDINELLEQLKNDDKPVDITVMAKNQSNSSLYHLYGDSIVVDVLMAIFREMV